MVKLPAHTKGQLLNARIGYFEHLGELINDTDLPEEQKKILTTATKGLTRNYVWLSQLSDDEEKEGEQAYQSLDDKFVQAKNDLLDFATVRVLPLMEYELEAAAPRKYGVVKIHENPINHKQRGAIIDTDNRTIIYGSPKNNIEELFVTSKPITAKKALKIPRERGGLGFVLADEYETGILDRLEQHHDPEKGARMYLRSVPSSFEEADFLEEKKGNFWKKSSEYHVKLE